MQRKNIALALLSLAPPPPVAAGAGIPGLDELVNAFTAALGLIIFFALTGAVILLVYVIIEALQHPRRGVAALAQVVAMNTLKIPDVEEINSRLPEDVAVLGFGAADSNYNPRRDVVAKHYRYVCEIPENFDVELAKRAASMLIGKHDFKFFCAREKGKTTVGRVILAKVEAGEHLTFDFVAPAFLRQQVRRMVQALLEVGTGAVDVEHFRRALEGEATSSFRPAPPEGLFLAGISYRKLVIQRDERAVERFVSYLRGRRDLRAAAMIEVLSPST